MGGGVFGVSGGQVNWEVPISGRGRAIVDFLATQLDQGMELQVGEHLYSDTMIDRNSGRLSDRSLTSADNFLGEVSSADFQSSITGALPRTGQARFLTYLRQFVGELEDVGRATINLPELVSRFNSGVSASDAAADQDIVTMTPPSAAPPLNPEPPF